MNINSWSKAFGKKVVKELFTEKEMQSILNETIKLTREEDKKDYIWKFYESENNKINRIEYFVNYNKFFNILSQNEKIVNQVNELMQEDSVLFKDKINCKYPNGEGFHSHQDITAGWGNYTNRHVSMALPMRDTGWENGGILFGKKENEQLTKNFTNLDIDIDYNLEPTKLGDAIFFDSYVPHKSGKNTSLESRFILFLTYTPKSEGSFYEQYHMDKFKNVPPDIYKIKGKKYRSGNSNIKKIYK